MNIYEKAEKLISAGDEFVLITRYNQDGILRNIEKRSDLRGGFECDEQSSTCTLTEYYAPKPRLLVFGGGHIALPVVQLGSMVGFDVVVYDDRPAFANAERFPAATQVICDSFEKIGNNLTIAERDYVVIITRGHRHDGECLRFALSGAEPFYLGMIGSRRRVAIVRRQVEEEGLNPSKLCSPIGLDIGAVTPEEIAIAIMAQLIEYKRKEDRRGHYHGNFAIDAEISGEIARSNERMALITIVRTDGSTPREEGAKMLVKSDGSTLGTIGGGCAESDVARLARDVLTADGKGWHLHEVDMTDSADEDGMVCGGTMQILVEVVN